MVKELIIALLIFSAIKFVGRILIAVFFRIFPGAKTFLAKQLVKKDHAKGCVVNKDNELYVTEQLLEERQRVLDAIPECPAHGRNCVPHAIDWINKMKKYDV